MWMPYKPRLGESHTKQGGSYTLKLRIVSTERPFYKKKQPSHRIHLVNKATYYKVRRTYKKNHKTNIIGTLKTRSTARIVDAQ
nr:hypothetical protein LK20_00103 [Oryctes rhinoceros nudivirus]